MTDGLLLGFANVYNNLQAPESRCKKDCHEGP